MMETIRIGDDEKWVCGTERTTLENPFFPGGAEGHGMVIEVRGRKFIACEDPCNPLQVIDTKTGDVVTIVFPPKD